MQMLHGVDACVYFVADKQYNRKKEQPDHHRQHNAYRPVELVVSTEIGYVIREYIRDQQTEQRRKH